MALSLDLSRVPRTARSGIAAGCLRSPISFAENPQRHLLIFQSLKNCCHGSKGTSQHRRGFRHRAIHVHRNPPSHGSGQAPVTTSENCAGLPYWSRRLGIFASTNCGQNDRAMLSLKTIIKLLPCRSQTLLDRLPSRLGTDKRISIRIILHDSQFGGWYLIICQMLE